MESSGAQNENKPPDSTARSPKLLGEKRGSRGDFCCVPGCNNQRGNDKVKGEKRSYYKFPPEGSKQRKLWVSAIRRADWKPRYWDHVCSDHFINGTKGIDQGHSGYVPSIFSFHSKITKTRESRNSSSAISPLGELQATPVIGIKNQLRRRRLYDESPKGRPVVLFDQPINTPSTIGHDYLKTDSITVSSDVQLVLPEIVAKIKRLEELEEINEIIKTQLLTLSNIKDNPKKVQFWTGFPSYENFDSMFKFLQPRAQNLQYWRGQVTTSTPHFSTIKSSKPGPDRKLALVDEFFLTMVRLKTGLLIEDMAQRFSISTGSVSSIFTSWINLMYSDLKMLCMLPSKSVLNENQSHAIRSFGDVRLILDCTELFIQNPSKLGAKKQFFSHYKHHNTFKFLIGISPQMGVTYVSRMYGGHASDKYITTDSSDLLLNLEVNKGSIMTDRGFLIHAMMSDMGVKVHMPAFKGSDRSQLSAAEAEMSEKISKVRIHVERVIQRIKTFHILDGEIKLSMKDIAEQIVTVCSYLVNFQTPIVK